MNDNIKQSQCQTLTTGRENKQLADLTIASNLATIVAETLRQPNGDRNMDKLQAFSSLLYKAFNESSVLGIVDLNNAIREDLDDRMSLLIENEILQSEAGLRMNLTEAITALGGNGVAA